MLGALAIDTDKETGGNTTSGTQPKILMASSPFPNLSKDEP